MKNTFLSGLLAPIILLGVIGQTHSETISSQAELPGSNEVLPFLRSDAYINALATNAAQFDVSLGRPCENGNYRVSVVGLQVLTPIVMNVNDIRPTAGRWLLRYEATRCGETDIYNVVGQVEDNGSLSSIRLVPGTTLFGFEQIVQMMRAIPKLSQIESCDVVEVADTIPGVPSGISVSNPSARYETWTAYGCGQQRTLVLRVPDRG